MAVHPNPLPSEGRGGPLVGDPELVDRVYGDNAGDDGAHGVARPTGKMEIGSRLESFSVNVYGYYL